MTKLSLTLLSNNKCIYSQLIEIKKANDIPLFELKKELGYAFIDIILVLYNKEGKALQYLKERTVGSSSSISNLVNNLINTILN